ncbi:MAG TPA: hypothetical protein VFC19_50525, partial [Candidatus Limnocylindrales bacterium]|nr:hypothetical protein [Candidatus Limnocylindrales bacterium]
AAVVAAMCINLMSLPFRVGGSRGLVVVVSGAQLENDVEKYINQHSTADETFTHPEQKPAPAAGTKDPIRSGTSPVPRATLPAQPEDDQRQRIRGICDDDDSRCGV